MLLENSYFEGLADPVIKDGTATLVQRGNVFSGTGGRNESGGHGRRLGPEELLRLHPRQGGRRAVGRHVRRRTARFPGHDGHRRGRSHHPHRRQGRLGAVHDRAGRGERRTREQPLPGRHRGEARHLPGDRQGPGEQAARHHPGHRRQPQGHADRLRQRGRHPQARRFGDVRHRRQRHRRRGGRRLPGPQPQHLQRLRRGRPPGHRPAGRRPAHGRRQGVPGRGHRQRRPGHAAARHRRQGPARPGLPDQLLRHRQRRLRLRAGHRRPRQVGHHPEETLGRHLRRLCHGPQHRGRPQGLPDRQLVRDRRRLRPLLLPGPALARGRRRHPRPADHRPQHVVERRDQDRSVDRHERLLLEGRPVRRVPEHRGGRGGGRPRPAAADRTRRPRTREIADWLGDWKPTAS